MTGAVIALVTLLILGAFWQRFLSVCIAKGKENGQSVKSVSLSPMHGLSVEYFPREGRDEIE